MKDTGFAFDEYVLVEYNLNDKKMICKSFLSSFLFLWQLDKNEAGNLWNTNEYVLVNWKELDLRDWIVSPFNRFLLLNRAQKSRVSEGGLPDRCWQDAWYRGLSGLAFSKAERDNTSVC